MSASKVVLKFYSRSGQRIFAKLAEPLPAGVCWHKGMVYLGPEFAHRLEVESVQYEPGEMLCVWFEAAIDEHSCGPDPASHYRKHGWLPEAEFVEEQEHQHQQARDKYLQDYAKASGIMLLPTNYSLVTRPADRVAYGDKSAFVDKGTENPTQQETQ